MKTLYILFALASPIAAALAQTGDAPKASPSSLNDALKKRQAQAQNRKLPVPANLKRRTLKVGEAEREFFLHVPDAVKGRPAPVVFALHGGAANSGLQMHYKSDYTKVADRAGFVVVYPSGLKGWNIGVPDAYFVRNF